MGKLFILQGNLLYFLLVVSGCVTNTVVDSETSPQLKPVEKIYPLVYEVKENNGQMGSIIGFLPGQGKFIVSGAEQWQVIDIRNRKVFKSFPHRGIATDYIQLSANNRRLLIASVNPDDKTSEKVTVEDTNSGKILTTFKAGGTSSANVGLSPDGRILFLDGALWDVSSGKKLMGVDPEFQASDHAFSADNHYFVIVTSRFGPRLFDIQTRREKITNSKPSDMTHPVFRSDNHYYASYNYDFNTSYPFGGDYPLSIGLFSPNGNSLVKQYTSKQYISCWTVMPDGKLFIASVNGDVLLLSADLIPIKRWTIKHKVRYCAPYNTNIWLGVDNSGVYKIDLASLTIEHPIKLKSVINKFVLSQDGDYLGLEAVIEKIARIQIYRVNE